MFNAFITFGTIKSALKSRKAAVISMDRTITLADLFVFDAPPFKLLRRPYDLYCIAEVFSTIVFCLHYLDMFCHTVHALLTVVLC